MIKLGNCFIQCLKSTDRLPMISSKVNSSRSTLIGTYHVLPINNLSGFWKNTLFPGILYNLLGHNISREFLEDCVSRYFLKCSVTDLLLEHFFWHIAHDINIF